MQSQFSSVNSANLSEIEVDHRYRLLIDAVVDYAIFMLDRSGNVASWNPGAQRAKGYAADEIVGRHFAIFYTDEDAAAGKPARLLAAAKARGRVDDKGWRVRKDGSRFWASVVITAVHDEDGELIGYAKITRDLTESRRLAELERVSEDSALVQQAQENERRRIARELHDDLGQRISALKMKLALHETKLVKHDAPAVGDRSDTIRELAEEIDGLATSIRRIAADLRPPILDDLGLDAALDWMTDAFEAHYGVSTRLEVTAEGLRLTDLAAISLYRVAQEALTNYEIGAESSRALLQTLRDLVADESLWLGPSRKRALSRCQQPQPVCQALAASDEDYQEMISTCALPFPPLNSGSIEAHEPAHEAANNFSQS